LLEKQGAITHYIPTVEIQPRAVNFSFFEPDIAIFLSANAVKYCPLRHFSSAVNYFAVGAATAIALMQRGVIAQQPEASNSEGLLALRDLQEVRGKEIAIFCGVGGRELLHETLRVRGAHCQRYEVYQRYCAVHQATHLQTLLKNVMFDCVICTSAENLLCLEKLAGMQIVPLYSTPLVVVSKRIAEIARKRGFLQVLIIDQSFDNKIIVDQLMKWREET
jgi:uroporphyrinogen-III synthase